MKKIFILLIGISSATWGYSTDCKTRNKYELYLISDVIFMGKIEELKPDNFTVRTYEIFKGTLKVDSIITIPLDEESILPETNELWLFYGSMHDDTVYVSVCSGSKKFSWPYSEGFNVINYVEPPPKDIVGRESLILIEKLWQDRALNELYFDILNLRQLQLKKLLQKAQTSDTTDLIPVEDHNLSKVIIMNYILIVLVIVLGVISIRYRTK